MAIKNSEELSQDIENQLLNREVVDDIQDALKKEKATIADAAAEQVADELLDPAALAIRLEAAKQAARAATSEVSGIAPEVQVPAKQKVEPAQGPSPLKGSEGDSEVPVDEEVESAEPGSDEVQEEQQPSPEPEQPKEKEQAQTESEPTAPSSGQAASQKSAAPQSQKAAAPAQKQQPSSEQPQPANEEDNAEQETDQEPEDDVPDEKEEGDDEEAETDDKEGEDEKEEGTDTDEDGESSGENTETESNEPSSKKSSSEVAPEDEASTAGDLNKEKAAARTAGQDAGSEAGGSMGGMPDVGTIMQAASGGREGVKNAAINAAKVKVAEEAGAVVGSALMPGAGTALGTLIGRLLVTTPLLKWLLIILFLLVCVSIVMCIAFFFMALYAVCDGFITGTLLSLSGFDCSWADSWLPGI